MVDQEILDPVEAVATAYLETADGNPSLALRLVIADAASQVTDLGRGIIRAEALTSRGYVRGMVRSAPERLD